MLHFGQSGIVLAFRRSECPYPVLQAGLRALKPDVQYNVEIFDESRARTEQTVSGRELQSDFELRLPTDVVLSVAAACRECPARPRHSRAAASQSPA